MDKNLPTNTGDTGSIPGLGISHMPWGTKAHVPQLLSPRAVEPMLRNKRTYCGKRPTHYNQGVAPTHLNQRKPMRCNEDPMQTKINLKK